MFLFRFYILCENFSKIGPIIKKIPKFWDDPLNKKERVNKLKQELVRLRLTQASTSAPPYISSPIASTFGTQRPPLDAPESSQASSSSEGDSTSDAESDYSGGSCSRASSCSPSRERAKEHSPYTRYHRWTPPRDTVRGRPASPYKRAPVEVSQRPALPLPVHLATYPSSDVFLPPPQAIPSHQLAASGDSPTQGAPSHPPQSAVREDAVQATVPAQSQEEDFREVIYYLPQGAHLHPGEAEGSVMVEWGERRYCGFKRVSVNPPAFSLTQKD